jgi:RimJ/RimL family protein N-acetyltransferase
VIEPRHYDVKDTLRNGNAVTIRAARPDDRERLVAAFEGLDPETVYSRFFSYKETLSDADLERATQADFDRRVVLLVTTGTGADEIVIGLGSYAAYDAPEGVRSAEVAFTVEEDYQGQGVASHLLRHLIQIARSKGFARFTADVLAANRAMIAVFARSGLPLREQREDGVVTIEMTL